MTSKFRAQLRSEAQSLDSIVMVGKEGVSDGVVFALKEALDCHELVKVRFVDFKENTKQLCADLEEKTDSTLVGTVGFTGVFYKKKEEK